VINLALPRSSDRVELALIAFSMWLVFGLFVGWTRPRSGFMVTPAGIAIARGPTIPWFEVQDIAVEARSGNARRCRVRYFQFSPDGRVWPASRQLLYTAWWYPDPDFDARVNLLLHCRQRYLDSLPVHPEGPAGGTAPQMTSK
jgi:hypothetical protein